MSEIVQIVAKRLREYRVQRGYTQEMLAEKSGLHNTYIGQVERAEKNITLASLEKILNALEINFSDLFECIAPSSEDVKKDYPLLCYELILSKNEDDQRRFYEIISNIDSMMSD